MNITTFFKKRIQNNKKGLTLIEAIVAIAMIAIVSVGVTSVLFYLSKTSKLSYDHLKQNAIYSVVKENVVISARNSTDIYGNTGFVASGIGTDYNNLDIVDRSGQDYPEYTFDLKSEGVFNYGDPNKQVDKYKITIKNSNNDTIAEFFTEVYSE